MLKCSCRWPFWAFFPKNSGELRGTPGNSGGPSARGDFGEVQRFETTKNVKEMYMGNTILPVAFRFSFKFTPNFRKSHGMMKHPAGIDCRPGLTAELLTPDSHRIDPKTVQNAKTEANGTKFDRIFQNRSKNAKKNAKKKRLISLKTNQNLKNSGKSLPKRDFAFRPLSCAPVRRLPPCQSADCTLARWKSPYRSARKRADKPRAGTQWLLAPCRGMTTAR